MRTVFFIYLALFLVMASSCQKKAASVSNNCITNPASCSSSMYQQNTGYSNYGNTSNPFNYSGNTAYLCNCPAGSMPTYNSYSGLGCVQTSYYNPSYFGVYAYMYLSWGNNQWNNMPYLSGYNQSSYSSSCYNGAVQSCVIGQANSCPMGTYCLESNAGSSLGLCVTTYR